MLRKFIAGLSALLLTAGLVTVIGGAASAHTPSASANCTAVTVNLTDYKTGGVNHVKVTQAGLVTYDADFGTTYQSVLPFVDATKANTWKVEVTAWDDLDKKGKSQGYSKTFSGTTKDCAPPPVVHKVQICHATASQGHPYSNDNQWVSWSSVNNVTNIDWNGHGNHNGDIIPAFADFPGKNWDATGQAIFNNGCAIPKVTVVPANPVIVDQCGVDNDSVTLATTAGVTYTRVGNDVYAALQSGYVWGTAPAGWVAAQGGKFKFHFDALSTKPCYVLVAWDMKAWGTPNWPVGGQTFVAKHEQTTTSLDTLDSTLNAIGYGCYQVDLYYDDDVTAALIAGGKLYGPNNPAEHLVGSGEGTAWKFMKVNNTCTHPPVDVCVDNHKQTIDWATYNRGKYELYSVNCEQPKDIVVDSDWTDGTWACNDTTVEQTRTHTVTPYIKVDGLWVPGTPDVTTTHQTRTLSDNEIKHCYVLVAWDMKAWGTPNWPVGGQTYVTHVAETVADMNALDEELDAIGYGCYQIDLYYDDDATTSLIADLPGHRVLYGPNNPTEHLAWDAVSPNNPWKFRMVGDSCEPKVPDTASVSFTQENICADLDGSGDLTVVGAHLVSATMDGEPYDGPLSDFHTGHYDATSEGTFVLTYEADEGYAFGDNPNVLEFKVTHKTAEECAIPVAVQFSADPTPASCTADGTLDTAVFPIVREGYTLTVNRPFDGPGVYTITATAASGYVFSGDGNPTLRTLEVTVDAQLVGGDCHVNVEPTLTATITPMCIQNVPFLDWTATMDDPDNQSSNPDNTVSFTFLNTKTADPNWKSDEYALTDNGDGTWSGSGRFAWPSAIYTGSLPGTIVGTGWPGFTYDAIADVWTDVGNLNNGWTRGGVDILAKVNPEYSILGVKYPAATNPCNPVELSNQLDAPPADPVEAEAQYAG